MFVWFYIVIIINRDNGIEVFIFLYYMSIVICDKYKYMFMRGEIIKKMIICFKRLFNIRVEDKK